MIDPVVVLVTGPPGTGKSTLSEVAADELNASVFGWDWSVAALTGFEEMAATLRSLDRETYRAVGWSIVWNLAVAQLRAGRSVVLDGVARDLEVEATRRLAAGLNARTTVVASRCSDVHLHRQRVETRRRNIPGWHELEWAHVAEFLLAWHEPADVDLRLDSADPFDANAAALVELIAREPR